MKAWAAGVAIAAVVVAAGLGLWVTWDSTQTAATDPVPPPTGMTTSSRAPAEEVPLATSTTVPPPCAAGDEVVTVDPTAGWDRVVIDTSHQLPDDYVPGDLVTVRDAGFATMDRVTR